MDTDGNYHVTLVFEVGDVDANVYFLPAGGRRPAEHADRSLRAERFGGAVLDERHVAYAAGSVRNALDELSVRELCDRVQRLVGYLRPRAGEHDELGHLRRLDAVDRTAAGVHRVVVGDANRPLFTADRDVPLYGLFGRVRSFVAGRVERAVGDARLVGVERNGVVS